MSGSSSYQGKYECILNFSIRLDSVVNVALTEVDVFVCQSRTEELLVNSCMMSVVCRCVHGGCQLERHAWKCHNAWQWSSSLLCIAYVVWYLVACCQQTNLLYSPFSRTAGVSWQQNSQPFWISVWPPRSCCSLSHPVTIRPQVHWLAWLASRQCHTSHTLEMNR